MTKIKVRIIGLEFLSNPLIARFIFKMRKTACQILFYRLAQVGTFHTGVATASQALLPPPF